MLSDPDKKAKYDRYGHAGLGGDAGMGGFDFSGGFGNLNDILNDLFGGGFGGFGGFGSSQNRSSQQRVYKGRDIRTRVRLSLEEINRGCEKEVTIERYEPCPDCGGRGAKNASDIQTCPHCHGSGQEQRVVNSLFGQTITYTTCSYCNGEGKIIKNACRNCGGTGLVRKKATVKVTIPAGVENGMQLTVRGEGHAAKNNGINGDLLILIEELPHSQLKRNGNNLYYSQIIPVTDAILGTEISVPTLEGTSRVKVDPGTQSGTVIRLRGKGLPSVKGYGIGNGDLYVKILVWIPKKLKRNEKEAIESMKGSSSFTPDLSRDDRAVFDKMKENF